MRGNDKGSSTKGPDAAQSQLEQKETWDTSEHTAEELIHLLTQTFINKNEQLHAEQFSNSHQQ